MDELRSHRNVIDRDSIKLARLHSESCNDAYSGSLRIRHLKMKSLLLIRPEWERDVCDFALMDLNRSRSSGLVCPLEYRLLDLIEAGERLIEVKCREERCQATDESNAQEVIIVGEELDRPVNDQLGDEETHRRDDSLSDSEDNVDDWPHTFEPVTVSQSIRSGLRT